MNRFYRVLILSLLSLSGCSSPDTPSESMRGSYATPDSSPPPSAHLTGGANPAMNPVSLRLIFQNRTVYHEFVKPSRKQSFVIRSDYPNDPYFLTEPQIDDLNALRDNAEYVLHTSFDHDQVDEKTKFELYLYMEDAQQAGRPIEEIKGPSREIPNCRGAHVAPMK